VIDAGAAYCLKVLTMMSELKLDSVSTMNRVTSEVSDAGNSWFQLEHMNPASDPYEKLSTGGRMGALLRFLTLESFDQNFPAYKDPTMLNLTALTPQHADALREIINDGFESAYLGPKEGFVAGTRKSAEDGMLQILASYIKSAKKWKSILLNMSDPDLIQSMVLDSMRIHASGTVPKLDQKKEPRYDEFNNPDLRRTDDCTEGVTLTLTTQEQDHLGLADNRLPTMLQSLPCSSKRNRVTKASSFE